MWTHEFEKGGKPAVVYPLSPFYFRDALFPPQRQAHDSIFGIITTWYSFTYWRSILCMRCIIFQEADNARPSLFLNNSGCTGTDEDCSGIWGLGSNGLALVSCVLSLLCGCCCALVSSVLRLFAVFRWTISQPDTRYLLACMVHAVPDQARVDLVELPKWISAACACTP